MTFREKLENNRAVITVVVIAAVGALLLFGWFGTKITAEENQLTITGLHGLKLPYDQINSVELIDQLPTITARTGGYSLGGKRLGNFMTKEYGAVKLYLQNNKEPFIFISGSEGKYYFINTGNPDETRSLYDDIVSRMN